MVEIFFHAALQDAMDICRLAIIGALKKEETVYQHDFRYSNIVLTDGKLRAMVDRILDEEC